MTASFKPAALCATCLAAAALALGACGGDDAEPATQPATAPPEAQAEDDTAGDSTGYSAGGAEDESASRDGASGNGGGASASNGAASGDSAHGDPGKSGSDKPGGRKAAAGVFGVASKAQRDAPESDQCRVKLQGHTVTLPCEVADQLPGG